MDKSLSGRLILIVEDEPLIAMEIQQAFEHAGARVARASTLREALPLVEKYGVAAAILDHALSDGDCASLCERLKERGVPFVIHSGYSKIDGVGSDALLVPKPASPQVLVSAVHGLLSKHPTA
jgi:DNA-binding response OmpR family regulator